MSLFDFNSSQEIGLENLGEIVILKKNTNISQILLMDKWRDDPNAEQKLKF